MVQNSGCKICALQLVWLYDLEYYNWSSCNICDSTTFHVVKFVTIQLAEL